MVDAPTHVTCLAQAARAAGVALPLCVAIDLSGVRVSHKSALRTADALLALLDVIDADDYVHFRGVRTFAGEHCNAPQGQRWLRRQLDAGSQRCLSRRRRDILERIEACGHAVNLFNGGAGSIAFNAADSSVNDITLGAELIMHAGDREMTGRAPATGLAMGITRRPETDIHVCFGDSYDAASMIAGGAS